MEISDTITIEAVVRKFIPDAMSDHYVSGGFASYDATELKIVAPHHLKGRTITVFHGVSPVAGSPLRKPNKKLQFSIQTSYLAENQTLFDGAISNIVELGS
jgi:hypothetical protein